MEDHDQDRQDGSPHDILPILPLILLILFYFKIKIMIKIKIKIF